jgi:hypothetical protein
VDWQIQVRREDDVEGDLGRIKLQIWSKMAIDREAKKKTVEQAKTYTAVVPSAEKMVQERQLACLEV